GPAVNPPQRLRLRPARGPRHDVGRLAAGRRHPRARVCPGPRGRPLLASRRVSLPLFRSRFYSVSRSARPVPAPACGHPDLEGLPMTELFRAPLTEQYRPKTWQDVVGQDKVVNRLLALRRRGLAGRAYWLSGPSGTGKTTIARLIAAEVAEEFCV